MTLPVSGGAAEGGLVDRPEGGDEAAIGAVQLGSGQLAVRRRMLQWTPLARVGAMNGWRSEDIGKVGMEGNEVL